MIREVDSGRRPLGSAGTASDGRISIVVPSLSGRADPLLASLAGQTRRPAEVEVVRGVAPSGRARNLGADRTTGEVLVFIDDDASLGDTDMLARLVAPLDDTGIGAVGAAKLLPPGSSWFQRMVARQVPRIEHPAVAELTESNPPIGRHGYTDVTTTCCAIRRDVFEACGGFDEQLVRGVDSELLYRLRMAGYRLVVAPATWVHHPAPASLRALLVKHFRYGTGYAQEVKRHPERAGARYLATPAHAAAYALLRTLLLLPHAVWPLSFAARSRRPGFKPLRALTSYAAALGYVYGWYRFP